MTPADALSDAWTRWCAFVNAAEAAEVDRRLARFNPGRPADVSLATDLLFRSVPLLQAALGWERPAAGPARRTTDTSAARGEQWRLVMGYAGFELLVKAALDVHPRVGLSRDEFARLVGGLDLPAYEPLVPPTPAAAVRDVWFPDGADGGEDHPALEYLGLNPSGARAFADWLVRRQPVVDWCSALHLAKTLRDATAHGALSATRVREWKLRPTLTRLLTDLTAVAAAAVAVLAADAAAPRPRPAEPAARPSVTRPVPDAVPGASSEQEAALVRAVAAAPEDDAPRLVYADWLEENGHAERAAFVRAGCEHDRLRGETASRWYAQAESESARRVEALTPRCEGVWRGPDGVEFAHGRGLPAEVRCRPDAFVSCGRDWLARAPTLHAVCIVDLGRSVRSARAVAGCEPLAAFTRLRFGRRASAAAVAELLLSPHLANLTELDLSDATVRAEGARALADAHYLKHLGRLELGGNVIGDTGLAALIASPVVERLNYLGLSGNALHDAGVRGLAASHRLASLVTLDLQANHVRDEGAAALAACPRLAGLRHLNLWGNRVGAAGLQALAASPHLAGLESLSVGVYRAGADCLRVLAESDGLPALARLETDGVTDAGLVALAKSRHRKRLRSLTFADESVTAAGWRALAGSDSLPHLRDLAVGMRSEGEGVEALAASRGLAGLERLELSLSGRRGLEALVAVVREPDGPPLELELFHERVGPVAAALAAGPGLARVRRLALMSDHLGDAGVRALCASPHLGGLTSLEIANNGIGPAGAAALAACPRLAGLTRLDLTNNWLGDEGVRRLAASRHLGKLAVLNLWGCGVTNAGAAALAQSSGLGDLRRLGLVANQLGEAGALAVVRSERLDKLARLDLSPVPGDSSVVRDEARRAGVVIGGE